MPVAPRTFFNKGRVTDYTTGSAVPTSALKEPLTVEDLPTAESISAKFEHILKPDLTDVVVTKNIALPIIPIQKINEAYDRGIDHVMANHDAAMRVIEVASNAPARGHNLLLRAERLNDFYFLSDLSESDYADILASVRRDYVTYGGKLQWTSPHDFSWCGHPVRRKKISKNVDLIG